MVEQAGISRKEYIFLRITKKSAGLSREELRAAGLGIDRES